MTFNWYPLVFCCPAKTTLGLQFCKRQVEHFGGGIRGGNRREGGAWFEITLPACFPSFDGDAEYAAAYDSEAGGGHPLPVAASLWVA